MPRCQSFIRYPGLSIRNLVSRFRPHFEPRSQASSRAETVPDSLAATGTEGRVAARQSSDSTGRAALDAGNSSMERQRISEDFAVSLPCAGVVSGRLASPSDVMTSSDTPTLTNEKPLVSKGFDASSRLVSSAVVSTGVRTRTGDLRIMRPPL